MATDDYWDKHPGMLDAFRGLFFRPDAPAHSTIAREMTAAGFPISRSASLSKARRLGWRRAIEGRVEPGPRAPRARRKKSPVGPTGARAHPTQAPRSRHDDIPAPLLRPNGEPHTMLDLTDQTCRWPIGDPQTSFLIFCANRPKPGSPYCPGHTALAYNTPNARSDKREAAWINWRSG